jgi:hypothetical protein
MSDTIEVHIDLDGETRLVGLCRYIARWSSRTSVFEYDDEWSEAEHAFAIDPENLPLGAGKLLLRLSLYRCRRDITQQPKRQHRGDEDHSGGENEKPSSYDSDDLMASGAR